MSHQKCTVLLILLLFLPLSTSVGQDTPEGSGLSLYRKEAILHGDGTDGPYRLPDVFILTGTEQVELDGMHLIRGADYRVDYDNGELTFSRSVPRGVSIRIAYERLPIGIRRAYLHRRPVRSEETDRSSVKVEKVTPQKRLDLPDMSSLRIGGSKSFGISLGSNRDLSLEQSLRVNITGQVARNVEVLALLSDQSSPLQPEGTTQTLEEIDKVSIELRGTHLRAAFGDYTITYGETEFGRLNRKLQGAMGQYLHESGQVTISGASSKGTFTTNRFTGVEGSQGPYQLRAQDGSVDIIVLAGTERVWIDGEPMTRGENNDYTIEYARGEITFTRHRLIAGESRIVVDFEYIDEEYRRSLYTGRGSVCFGGKTVRLGATFFHEADDKDDPLGVSLSDTDRDMLATAGDDPEAAFRFAEDGSTKVYLPLPRSHSLADFDLGLSTGAVELTGEVGLSRYDNNIFSQLDDADNVGAAYTITGTMRPQPITVRERNLGNIELTGLYRTYGDRFQPVGRMVIPEYDRRWNAPSEYSQATENVRELHATYRPHGESAVGFGIGRIERGEHFEATRKEVRSDITVSGLPGIHYLLERIDSKEQGQPEATDLTDSHWTRHTLRSEYSLWRLTPTVTLEGERKEESQSGRTTDGFKFYEVEGGLSASGMGALGAFAGCSYRRDWEFDGRWLEASEAKTIQQSLTLKEWRSLSGSAEYTHRRKHFLEKSDIDRTTDLADIKVNYTPFHRALSSTLRYQVSSLHAAKKERQFVDVGEWRGTYRLDELTDEYIYDPGKEESRYLLRTKTVGDFEPVTELRASLSLKISPGRHLAERRESRSKLTKALNMIETETVVRIEEKSKEKDRWAIYLFDLSKFQQDSTTIDGRITLRQDLFLFPFRERLNLRFRCERNDDESNQFIGEGGTGVLGEERLRTEQSVRARSKLGARFDLQGEVKRERITRKVQNFITYDIRSHSLSSEMGYRPHPPLELSLKATYDHDGDRPSGQRSLAFSLTPGVSYSILGRGRARADMEWTHVSVEREDLPLYYTMAGGRREGDTVDWSLNVDYRIHRHVTALISYTGRSEPDRRAVHSGRAEMRAFF